MGTHERWRHRGDDGGAATLEWVIVFPAMFFAILLTIEFGLWAHASHVAEAAAQEGARAARAEDGSAEAGSDRARAFISDTGAQVLLGPDVKVERGSDVARVTVKGKAVSVLPGLEIDVNQSAAQTVERFRPDGGP
jgi:Flp pilus assembly protein TadG